MNTEKLLKISDPVKALKKAQSYCNYQERSQQEMRDKLYEWGLWTEVVEEIIAELIVKGYLNEERFARTYAGGKFRIKKWGKNKIKEELKKRKISEYCIKTGLSEINERQYKKVLMEIINLKIKSVKEKNQLKKNYKVAQYVISRGFETELVWEVLNEKH